MSRVLPGGIGGADAPPQPGGDLASVLTWPPGRVLVVTATYNDRGSIGALVDRVLGVEAGLQMLVVDDDSPDGTGTLVLDLARTRPRLHVLVRRGRRGLGSAIIEVFRAASAHWFAVALNMDADFSHDPEGYAVLEDMLIQVHRAGGRIVEVPITFTDRTVGESKAGLRQRRDAALALLRMAIRAWRP